MNCTPEMTSWFGSDTCSTPIDAGPAPATTPVGAEVALRRPELVPRRDGHSDPVADLGGRRVAATDEFAPKPPQLLPAVSQRCHW